jgi:hypothetical protein
MNTNDTFLAIFLANKTGPRMTAWNALSEEAAPPLRDWRRGKAQKSPSRTRRHCE